MPPTPPPAASETQPYPAGEDCPTYRLAFNAYVVLFLIVVCAGLLNYLGTFAKRYF
jgi:hypothetical protein